MSRTRHGSKGPGYEYWSRRPCKLRFPDPGPYSKMLTHRAERRHDHAAEHGLPPRGAGERVLAGHVEAEVIDGDNAAEQHSQGHEHAEEDAHG